MRTYNLILKNTVHTKLKNNYMSIFLNVSTLHIDIFKNKKIVLKLYKLYFFYIK